ncbi:MAG: 16S rRNA (cytosine(1402)-N(4))-methyltransferase RsmH [Alphaproteobacteria bacterium]|nr:16S rRNA (cytosine(1402)-N(4))-methyltransferase RsmH [Alphaproteobacteria bacterium]
MIENDIDNPHYSVLMAEVLDTLAAKDNEVIVDGTFGAGGYSRNILNAAEVKLYAIDRDPNAVAAADAMKAEYTDRFEFLQGQFGDMQSLLADVGVERVDGIVLDIGISSMQIDQAERGFSFMREGPLDMRMSVAGMSAADVVNKFSEAELARIFYILGDEKRSYPIAGAIVRQRAEKPFETTLELANLVENTIKKGKSKIHVATKVFQALRIFVNQELAELVKSLNAAEALLKPGGRLVIVSFHSLEDRIVKNFLKSRTGNVSAPSRHVMVVEELAQSSFTLINRKVITATKEELEVNIRSRSAKLRAAMRTDAPSFDEYFNPLPEMPNLA